MSGIVGYIEMSGAPTDPGRIERMLGTMASRGPDHQSFLHEGPLAFGQAMLATTAEARAEMQPWRHADTGCLVVSDSRLDHRQATLESLGIDRPADMVGDAELLHAAWQKWGESTPDRLRGDFAFAIHDPGRGVLFLARDPMGVRPLHVHFQAGRRFAFASTPRALLAHGAIDDTLDETRLADALLGETEGVDATRTFHRAINRLPAGHWLLLRDGSPPSTQRYWRPVAEAPPPGLPATTEEWVEAQRAQLDLAVRLRLRGDRRVGSMLSGGLDSSSIVALACDAQETAGQPPFPVFSAVDSRNPHCPETRAIRSVASHSRCSPTEVDLARFEVDCLSETPWWDSPDVEPFDSGMTLVALLYRDAARQGIGAMLDGVPADNLYANGDYPRRLFSKGRWREAWHASLQRWNNPLVRHPRMHALRQMAGCTLPGGIHATRRWLSERRLYGRLLAQSLITPEAAGRLDLWQRYQGLSRSIAENHQWHPSGQALSTLASPYITAALERYNRVASLYAIEPRHPFADRDLIEFMAWMPIPLRTAHGHLKWVLRQAMANDLPAEVAWRGDKRHLGAHFSQVQLLRDGAGGIPHSPFLDGLVDRQRLARLLSSPSTRPQASQALALSRWQHAASNRET